MNGDEYNFHWLDDVVEFDKFKKILPDISESPFLYHLHITFPHPPIRFDANCKRFSIFKHDLYERNYELWSNSFLKQIKCAEKQIMKIAKKIIEHDKNAFIIIQSDGGFDYDHVVRDATKQPSLSGEATERVLGIYSAFKLPELCYKYFDIDKYSLVNTFRIIFGCLDNKKPVLLPFRAFAYNEYLYEMRKNNSGEYEVIDF